MVATGVVEPSQVGRGRGARTLHLVIVVALAGGVLSIAVLARAYWTQDGAGTGGARVSSLGVPAAVTATPIPGRSEVPVTWTGVAAPDGGMVDGYYLQRYSGGTPSPACSSSPGTMLAPGTTSCSDPSVPDGTYTYTFTAVYRS